MPKDQDFDDLMKKHSDELGDDYIDDNEDEENKEQEEDVNPKEKVKDFLNKGKNKREGKGFNTLNSDEIDKKKDSIKKATYMKLVAIGIGSLFLLATIIFIFGDKQIRQNGKNNSLGEINDSIQSGNISPNVDLFKKQILDMQFQMKQLQDALANKNSMDSNSSYSGMPSQEGNLSNEVMNTPAGGINDAALSPREQELTEENNRLKSIAGEGGGVVKEPLPQGGLQPEAPLPTDTKIAPTSIASNKKPSRRYYDYDIQSMGGAVISSKTNQGTEQSIYDDNGSVVATSKGLTQPGGAPDGSEVTFDIVTGLSKALLITGVEAPTFSDGVANPKPVILKFTSPILTANKRNINIKECNALGSAYGNMNTSRAEITITKLNCFIEKDNKTFKVSQEVKGYVIGEDGSFGVPGRLVDSGAKMVMKQLQVGFLQGVGQAFQAAVQPSVTINSYGSTSTTTTPSISDAGKYGLSGGANTGLNALVEYYKSMMNGVYPVVSIRGGRKVGVLWNGGESLAIKATKLFNVNDRGTNSHRVKSGGINYNAY